MPDVIIQRPSPDEIFAAKVQVVTAIALAIAYGIEIADSLNKLGDYLDKQTGYAEYYHDRYVNITYPQQIKAIEDALAFEIIGPEYDSYPYWAALATRHAASLENFESIVFGSYCMTDFGPCDRQLRNAIPPIAGDAAFIEAKVGERREEQMRSDSWEFIGAMARVINKPPDNIFKYINNAITIRQGLLNMAVQGFNGALGSINIELGSLRPRYAGIKSDSTSGGK